jgi:hypothetical protein
MYDVFMGEKADVGGMVSERQGVYCPACGYDLRGALSDRCSECGLPIVGGQAQYSQLKWHHRNQIGLWRAFWWTVLQVTRDNPEIRDETARIQDGPAARVFRRWVTVALALAILGPVIVEMFDGTEELVGEWWISNKGSTVVQLLWPWGLAMKLPIMPPLLTLLFVLVIVCVPRWLCTVRHQSEAFQERATALGDYATAPMALLPPVPLLIATVSLAGDLPASFMSWALSLNELGVALGGMLLLATVQRTGLWYARVRHGGTGTVLVGMTCVFAAWIIAGVLFFWFLPWCVGYVIWILRS